MSAVRTSDAYPWHHYHRTATSVTGAPIPAQRQALWAQQLSCRPLAQTLKTAILTRPSAERLKRHRARPVVQALSERLSDPAAAVAIQFQSDRNATDSGCGRAVTADCFSDKLAHGTRGGPDQIPLDYRSSQASGAGDWACRVTSVYASPGADVGNVATPRWNVGSRNAHGSVRPCRALRGRRNDQRSSTLARIRVGQRFASTYTRAPCVVPTSCRRRRSGFSV